MQTPSNYAPTLRQDARDLVGNDFKPIGIKNQISTLLPDYPQIFRHKSQGNCQSDKNDGQKSALSEIFRTSCDQKFQMSPTSFQNYD